MRPAHSVHQAQETIMKTFTACAFAFCAVIAPAAIAQPQSLPDSNPECMQVNGPDCVLKDSTVPSRISAPRITITPPLPITPVVPVPPPTERVPGPPVIIAPNQPFAAAPGAPTDAGATAATAAPASRAPGK